MIRNIIFDWSGTLVDDLPAVWISTNHVLEMTGVPLLTLDEFRAEFQLPFQKFYQRHTPQADMVQLESWFHSKFRECQHEVKPLAHARAFLEFCRDQSLRTFVLSTIHPSHYATQCGLTGFGEFIERAYLEAWDKTQWIHRVLDENSLDAAETLFIGDMTHDVETARHGGVHSCAVLTGYNRREQLEKSSPGLIVDDLGVLQDLLSAHGLAIPPATKAGQGISVAEARPDVDGESAINSRPIATVGAVIFNDREEVLMIRTHKWSDLWGIPGGKIEYRETAKAALIRELGEETGLTVRDIEFVMTQDCIGSREFYRDAHFLLLNYRCRAVPPANVILNDEAEEFRWVSLDQARRLPLNQPTRILLEAVSAKLPHRST
ncbi:MAG: NUDIX domain-containing protein [Verrucomicrobia bacterium]|nr:NUDIX domain-containing protein [Verrucomicrobiota bacterium]